jgi:hypothetical protein
MVAINKKVNDHWSLPQKLKMLGFDLHRMQRLRQLEEFPKCKFPYIKTQKLKIQFIQSNQDIPNTKIHPHKCSKHGQTWHFGLAWLLSKPQVTTPKNVFFNHVKIKFGNFQNEQLWNHIQNYKTKNKSHKTQVANPKPFHMVFVLTHH